jgi:serpin B
MTGCSLTAVDVDETQTPPRALSDQEQALIRSEHQFGLTLFRSISETEPNDNTLVSPLSVSMALGMTLSGAAGETRAAMEKTLALTGLSPDDINDAYARRIRLLRQLDPSVTFELANSIWHREGFPVEPSFVETNQQHFDAVVRALDFARPDALGTINGWVEDKTRGKIDTILDRIRSDEIMFLINALYFKGTWTYAFDENQTREALFTQHDGSTTPVPMMHQTTDLPYFETESLQAVDVPYGDSLYSMTVLLPKEGHDVDDVVARLDAAQWTAWMDRLTPRAVELRLPRFTLTHTKTLNAVLTALGMGVAFDCEQADFTGINPNSNLGLCLSRVQHKAFVEVNEEGTEAAAVTSVGISVVSAQAGTPVHVDRPFGFVIRERHSGTILFVGKVNRL